MAGKQAKAATGKPGGRGGLMVTVAALTVIAAAGGGLIGKVVGGRSHQTTGVAAAAVPKPLPYAADVEVRELAPVVTNLTQPAEARVRMQVAMVYPKAAVENPALLGAKINDDIIAFLATLSVTELQGPSGLQALREDLNERARIRSDGKVREIIIEALVVQ